jgi:hypothetical protein
VIHTYSPLFIFPTLIIVVPYSKELTKGRLGPTGCLLDFEEAMASAWITVFPNCSIMRDYFHLKQAKMKKLHKIGLSHLRQEAGHDIGVIWYADTKEEFDTRLEEFLNKWDEKAPQYTDYFRRVWIGQHPPHTWAAFGRGKDTPSGVCWLYYPSSFLLYSRLLLFATKCVTGSGSIEGHHNRLQNVIMPGFGSTAVDRFANKLWDEEKHYLDVMTNPHMWSEKKTEHMKAVQRHLKYKRTTLKNTTGSRTITHHTSYRDSHTSATVTTTNTTATTATTAATFTTPLPTYIDLGLDSDDDDDLDFDADGAAGGNSGDPNSKQISPPPSSPCFPLPPPSSSPTVPAATTHPFFQMANSRRLSTPLTPSFTSSNVNATTTTTTPPPLPPRLNIFADERCKCGQYKINKACANNLCRKCCNKSMDHCVVSGHIKDKPLGYQTTKYKKTTPATASDATAPQPRLEILPGVVDHLAKAMNEGRPVFMAYVNRDPNEKKARKVKPIEWIRYGEVFKALCFTDDYEKTYLVERVRRIEDQGWTVAATMTATASSEGNLSSFVLYFSRSHSRFVHSCSCSPYFSFVYVLM